MKIRQVRGGMVKVDQLLLAFMLMMAAWTCSQPIAALTDHTLASPGVTAQNTSSSSRSISKAVTVTGKASAISPPLLPVMSAFQHTAPPPSTSAGSPEFSPLAAPTASTPSPAPKPSISAPSRPHPLGTHRPVTPPSRPSTIPDWSYSRPQPYPHSSDALPPDTMDTLPPPPPPRPFTSIPTILPSPTVSTPIPDPAPSESKSVLNGGVTAGIVIGGISAAALVAMVAFIVGKRKANITRAQFAHAVRREEL
ncbi:hypothetical protein O6H91_02G154100 [Diphasiastrum complanatum]|uniref:Uncharacterized protein n=1 Tax=Diphasiastrum complanatum TaxID=34168 RepID=A0ACC2EM92_DIPCM|nr:hypothetical protein O6H91_02G154100 [Diphasiastrum complanatum]